MRYVLKAATAILLSISILYFTTGYFLVFWSLQSAIKYRVRELIRTNQIEQSRLTMIKITAENANNLFWTEENEFCLNGKMYDVVKKVVQNADIYYFCSYDVEETYLISYFGQYVKDLINSNSIVKNLIEKLSGDISVSNIFIYPIVHIELFLKEINPSQYSSLMFDILPPPPKFLK
jgi:uncharacterized membrane protein YwzB